MVCIDQDQDPGLHPASWEDEFDLGNWSFWLAREGKTPVGGITLAYSTPGVNMLEGRRDLGVIRDLRIAPDYRNRGLGRKLFQLVLTRAEELRCSLVKVETQNTNPEACRFYAAMGGELGVINRFAYGDGKRETMLVWCYHL